MKLGLQLLEARPRHVDRLNGDGPPERLAFGGRLPFDLHEACERDRDQLLRPRVRQERSQRFEPAGWIDAAGSHLVLIPF